jgi:hypothetical protein
MKYFRSVAKPAAFFTGLVFLTGACQLREENVNPNASTDAPVGTILTGGQATLGFGMGADLYPIAGIFVQQFAGANGDAAAYEDYTEGPGRFDIVFNDLYATPLKNLDIVLKKAKASNSPYYAGIARILLTFGFGSLTDVFGDIPYSEALQGAANPTPHYDKQEDIYKALQLQLDSAIAELSLPKTSFTTPAPATDDIIYQGNTAKWIAAAYTLKARYAIHLTKIDEAGAVSKALEYSSKGIATNQGDLQINFGSASTNSNPFSQIQSFRSGWLSLSASLVNLLNGNLVTDPGTKAANKDNIDPRRGFYALPNSSGVYKGFRLGESGAASYIGPAFATATSPVLFSSFAENKFIEAEARLRQNPSDPLVKTALSAGITASFDKYITGTADTNATPAKKTAYINKVLASLTGDKENDLKVIITQKYIALFTQSEVWVDYRRTGYPEIVAPAKGAHGANPNGQIPRRFLYPSREQVQNPNIPTLSATHQSPRLWWDK